MNSEELARLKELAQDAEPGPWSYNGNCRFGVWSDFGKFYVFEAGSHADAAYTAAANPVAVLEIIAKVEALEAFGRQDSLDAERYRAFFSAGLPICFMGEEYRDKESLDAAIDEYLKKGE